MKRTLAEANVREATLAPPSHHARPKEASQTKDQGQPNDSRATQRELAPQLIGESWDVAVVVSSIGLARISLCYLALTVAEASCYGRYGR